MLTELRAVRFGGEYLFAYRFVSYSLLLIAVGAMIIFNFWSSLPTFGLWFCILSLLLFCQAVLRLSDRLATRVEFQDFFILQKLYVFSWMICQVFLWFLLFWYFPSLISHVDYVCGPLSWVVNLLNHLFLSIWSKLDGYVY